MIKYQGLTTLEVLEDAENYNNWIIEQFLPFLKSPILEIGSGTGNLSRFFITRPNVYLSDIDEGLIKHLGERFPSKKKNILLLNIEKETPKKFHNYFKSIIGINVLEHIKDDTQALHNMHTLLQPKGDLFLLIPAKQMAYTQLDKILGHFRRYEKEDIEQKLIQAGFSIERTYSFNFVGLISWILRDKIERGNHLKTYQIRLFDTIVPILKRIEKILPPFTGVSLIIKAKKKK